MRSWESRLALETSGSLRCSEYIVKAKARFADASAGGDTNGIKDAIAMLDKASDLLEELSKDVIVAFESQADVMRLHCLLIGVPGVTYKEAFHLSIAFVKQVLTDGRQIVKLRHNSTLMQAIADSVGLSGFSHHRLHEIVRKIVKSGLFKQSRPRRPRRPPSSPPAPRRHEEAPRARVKQELKLGSENKEPDNKNKNKNREVQKTTVEQRPKQRSKLSFRDFEPRALDVVTQGGVRLRLLN